MKINTILFVLSVFSIMLLAGCSQHNTLTPNVSAPNTSTPNVSTSNVSTSNTSTPNTSTPNVSTSNVSTSNTSTPNVSTSNASPPDVSRPKACTEEAKICPDGSSVGRTGPNCEFQECPEPQVNKLKANDCIAEERGRECPEVYVATCGWYNQDIQCTTHPCAFTYANSCEACNDEKVAYWTEGPCPRTDAELQSICDNANGTWLSGTKECEGMSQTQCSLMNGEFNECASACRNDPNVQVCTLQCIPVCQFVQ